MQTIEDRQFKSLDKKGGKWYRRTLESDAQIFGSVEVTKTTISTTATKIDTPERTNEFRIINNSGATIYIGGSDVTTLIGFPLLDGNELSFSNMKKNNNNEIYGIVAASTEDIFVIGSVRG